MIHSAEEAIVIEPQHSAKMSVIWLHGLGADATDFVPIIEALRLPPQAAIRFIFPYAPVRAIAVNGGMMMRGWYDIPALDLTFNEDEAGILASVSLIEALIAHEQQKGMPAQKIIIAGFSQGGAIALQVGLRAQDALGGILALSTYLPLASKLSSVDAHLDLPIAMYHGIFDPVVPYYLAQMSRDKLKEIGFKQVEWQSFPMTHAVCDEELDAIKNWLVARYSA